MLNQNRFFYTNNLTFKMLPIEYIKNAVVNTNHDITISDCASDFIDKFLEKIVDNIEQYYDNENDISPQTLNNYINEYITGNLNDTVKDELNGDNKSRTKKYVKDYMMLKLSPRSYNYIGNIIDVVLGFMIDDLIAIVLKEYRNKITQMDVFKVMTENMILQALSEEV